MTTWLAGVHEALDRSATPVTFFVRDDDVGWADDNLFALLDEVSSFEVPIDLAVIPCALTPALADRLRARPQPISFHQHGYAHVNHEPVGRKCEFGPSRVGALQRQDIALGWQRLHELLGKDVQRIFTPPWNRCTPETGECLRELGFVALSRDLSAGELGLPGLSELPITFDWFAQRKGVPLERAARGDLLASRIAAEHPVGVMLHHSQMDALERACFAELLRLLAAHPRARLCAMSALLAASPS